VHDRAAPSLISVIIITAVSKYKASVSEDEKVKIMNVEYSQATRAHSNQGIHIRRTIFKRFPRTCEEVTAYIN
jgi:hypothetical protein